MNAQRQYHVHSHQCSSSLELRFIIRMNILSDLLFYLSVQQRVSLYFYLDVRRIRFA